MRTAARNLPPFVVPLLLAVAVVGYLAGLHRVTTPSGQVPAGGAQVASGVNVLLEFPRSWEQATTASSPPALELGSKRLSLVSRARPREAGLLSGVLQVEHSEPLPRRLLAAQRGVPHTEVVNLVTVQAFRYRHLIVPGYKGSVDLYVVPTPNEGATALACYAAPGLQAALTQCEQIVASLTLVGQTTSVLTPDVAYAHKLAALIDTLDGERLNLRQQLSRGTGTAAVAGAASSLAARFAATSTSLASLEPPPVVGPAQVRLARSLLNASVAYRALQVAAHAESVHGYATARNQVQTAESSVDSALEGFSLLGYSQS